MIVGRRGASQLANTYESSAGLAWIVTICPGGEAIASGHGLVWSGLGKIPAANAGGRWRAVPLGPRLL